jgi:hypothetical protein
LVRDALTGADVSPASGVADLAAARVRLGAVRVALAESSGDLSGVDLESAAFDGAALVASPEAAAVDLRAEPLEVVVSDALDGADERTAGADFDAGAVLADAGRAGEVVPADLPVDPVRLVAVAFRGRVWFAATVTFGWAGPSATTDAFGADS